MRLKTVTKSTGVLFIVFICSGALGSETATQWTPLASFPAVKPPKTPSNGSLENIIAELRRNSTDDQYRLITKAIEASPTLAAQISTLAENQLVTGFIIIPSPSSLKLMDIFGAQISGADWVFTPAFLEQQGTARIFDVIYEGDILPNNMVFALGHLAFHAQKSEQFDKDVAAYSRNGNPDIEKLRGLYLRNEAGASIQGWNDVIDAAVLENHGNALTGVQIASLMMSLRHRWIFFSGAKSYNFFTANGSIEQSDANVEAIVTILHKSKVMDIQ